MAEKDYCLDLQVDCEFLALSTISDKYLLWDLDVLASSSIGLTLRSLLHSNRELAASASRYGNWAVLWVLSDDNQMWIQGFLHYYIVYIATYVFVILFQFPHPVYFNTTFNLILPL